MVSLSNQEPSVDLAVERGEAPIPVKYVDLSEEDESLILAVLDPISAMAGTYNEILSDLLRDIRQDDALGAILEGMARMARPQFTDFASPEPLSNEAIAEAEVARDSKMRERAEGRRERLLDVTCPHCSLEFGVEWAQVLLDNPRRELS